MTHTHTHTHTPEVTTIYTHAQSQKMYLLLVVTINQYLLMFLYVVVPIASRLEIRVKGMMEGLIENVQSGFDLYKAPMEKMLASYDRMTTDSQLISALATFGRQSAPAGSVAWRMARRGMQASMKIGVQPTAVARRKTPLGGRRALITGPPTKKLKKRAQLWKGKGQFTTQKAGTT